VELMLAECRIGEYVPRESIEAFHNRWGEQQKDKCCGTCEYIQYLNAKGEIVSDETAEIAYCTKMASFIHYNF